MPEVILSDYFYGDESEEFIYFKIPRLLHGVVNKNMI